MVDLRVLAAACLLPVFPLSALFNQLVEQVRHPAARALAVLGLPEAGAALLEGLPRHTLVRGVVHSPAVVALVLCTSLLYALRALSVREVTLWARLVATSGLSLDWLLVGTGAPARSVELFALAWSVPAALLMVWAGLFSARLGGAYLGLRGGLAARLPRLSWLVALSALALVATPLFPSFFGLLHVVDVLPLSQLWAVLGVLFLWAWATGRFLGHLLFGTPGAGPVADLPVVPASLGVVVLVGLVVLGVLWSGRWTGI
jgi:NADH:ubiquinone oxidoreductase subunit 4 (subunit M)